MPGIYRFSKGENTQDAEGQKRKKKSTRGYSNVAKDAWARKSLEEIRNGLSRTLRQEGQTHGSRSKIAEKWITRKWRER